MSRFKYQSFAKDGNGSVVSGATVSVYLAGTTTAASVYTASSGDTAVNSVTSGTDGYFYFWVDDGDYTGEQFFDLYVSKAGFGTKSFPGVEVLPLLYAGSGTTANRPAVTTVGMYYVDTDLGQVVFWDGSAWTLFTLESDSSPTLGGDLDLDLNGIIYDTGGTSVTAQEIGYLDGVSSGIQTQLDAKVAATGNETIAGIKTFSSFPVTPSSAPSTDYQVGNKKYTDDAISNMLEYTLSTSQASTSGTYIDFTSIPSGVNRVTIMFSEVSTNGVSHYSIQIGDSGGIEATGYSGAGVIFGASSMATLSSTTGFKIYSNLASYAISGKVVLTLLKSASNLWVCSGECSSTGNVGFAVSGSKSISGELDRIRITTDNGTDTFDAGEINISYEG